jgi:hypothetical protein
LLSGIQKFAASGVQFIVNTRGPEVEGARMTDQDGRFEFPAVRPGQWRLEAELVQNDGPNGFYFASTSIVPTVVSDRDVGNIELRFEPSFSLDVAFDWGDDRSHKGNRTGSVKLIRVDSRSVPSFDQTTKDTARFEHFVPGRYSIVPGPEVQVGFYASAVMVDGRNVLGQEVELTAASTVQIVYKPNGARVHGTVEQGEGSKVLLWPQSAEIPDMVTLAEAGPRGDFEITNVSPGRYFIVAFDRIDFGAQISTAFGLSIITRAPSVQVEEAGTVSLTLPVTHWQDQ